MSRPGGPYFRLLDDRGALPALDGLRGIAILMVVVYHAADSFRPDSGSLIGVGSLDLATPAYSGWMGVNLFFVLSGFLITYHLLRRWSAGVDGREIRIYLAKRWLRIVPTYYLVLAFAALGLARHHPYTPDGMGIRVAYHLLFLQDYLPSSIVGPFWSLGVEEKFYLVMPVVLLLAWGLRTTRQRAALAAALALTPLVFRLVMWPDTYSATQVDAFTRVWRNPFHLNLDALILGAVCAWVYVHRADFPRLSGRKSAWALVGGGAALLTILAIVPGMLQDVDFYFQVAVLPLTAIGMAAVLGGSALLGRGAIPALECRWLARAGRVAYPWYLTHVLVMWFVWEELIRLVPGIRDLSPIAQFGLFFPLFFVASALVAVGVHFAIEKPCLILKDRIGAPRRARGDALTAGAA